MKHVLIGNHPSIVKIRELVRMVSDMALNVLLLGETGTGKEVVARLLHTTSSRHKKKFVKVNCAALPGNLLESELFGYEKGAFTGAVSTKPGKFEQASGGVIFLDEIGDMPIAFQAKLLNVLQTGEFTRLGGVKKINANSWIISSTNNDLSANIKSGLFREDLFYRLNVIKIELPPLRERMEDIPLLVRYLIEKHENDHDIGKDIIIRKDMMDLFAVYHWPGNVRELSSVILRLMMGDKPDEIKRELFRNMNADSISYQNGASADSTVEKEAHENMAKKESVQKSLKKIKAEAAECIEREAISYVLNMTGGNKRRTAQKLGISYKALFNKINKFEIE